MNNTKIYSIILFFGFTLQQLNGQELLKNPSFEGDSMAGGVGSNDLQLNSWLDLVFSIENSPPDIHSEFSNFWGVSKTPQDGKTFLGLVTREDGSHEVIGQELKNPLVGKSNYIFTIQACIAEKYESATIDNPRELSSFANGVIIRIEGAKNLNRMMEYTVLAESEIINWHDWREIELNFSCNKKYGLFSITAYHPDEEEYINGHVLIDNASLIEVK